VFGSLFAVEFGDTGDVLAALHVTEPTACKHRLHEYPLDLDAAAPIREHMKDYEPFEPVCNDARHLLADIGVATRAADRAEIEYEQAARAAKACKEIAEKARAHVLELTRNATNPRVLPLFDRAGA
jgi:hypothetical protein